MRDWRYLDGADWEILTQTSQCILLKSPPLGS